MQIPKKKTRPRAPNWQHKLATISPPARHTCSQEAQHTPPSTARNHHGEACFGACLGACFRHLSWFNQAAAERFSCVPLASKRHKSKATRPCSQPVRGPGRRRATPMGATMTSKARTALFWLRMLQHRGLPLPQRRNSVPTAATAAPTLL